jgi:phosphatidylserine/phosphatidylglycerophosphate/cardiolipin synthase-like enzyme
VPPALDDGVRGRVAISASLRVQDIRRSLFNRVRAAQERIWITTAYFVPSRKLLRALKRAALRGVDVRLLLPGPYTDHPAVRHAGRRFYGGLLRAGVRVFEYQPRFLHAKTALCDRWVSVGSSNFDRWNLRWNLEANQEVQDAGFAAAAAGLFERDLLVSEEIRRDDWRRRSWRARVREQLWGRVDMFLESLGRLRGIRMK